MKISFETNNRELISNVSAFIDDWNSSTPMIATSTSGSTGKPKTIIIEKQYMIASAKMTGQFFGLKSGDSALLCLSPDTIAGKMMIVRSIVLDLDLIVVESTSNPLSQLDRKVDFVAMVPYQVEHSLDELNKVEKLIVGGGAISPELWGKICTKSVEAYQTFGMTETISHIAMRRIEIPEGPYMPLKGVAIKSDEEQLVIRAPHLGLERLKTNDRIKLNQDGSFHWFGRADFVINSGGIKIHPEAIETVLSSLIQHRFFSIGLKDQLLGEKHVLCIEGKMDIGKEQLMKVLENYHIPKEVYFFNAFNVTQSGKIDRFQTIERLADAERKVL